jgi:type II secretory pathway component PulF
VSATTTTFVWKGKTAKGDTIAGEYKANDRREVAEYLRKRRVVIQSVRKKPKDIGSSWAARRASASRTSASSRASSPR